MIRARKVFLGVALLLVAALAVAGPAAAKDRNNDRIPDRWEKKHDLSLKVKQTHRDQDRDGLKNLGEYRSGSDPRSADSDNDGTEDGDENAGVITAFDGTTLTIDLYGGGTITGTVDESTEVKCGNECGKDGPPPRTRPPKVTTTAPRTRVPATRVTTTTVAHVPAIPATRATARRTPAARATSAQSRISRST